MQDRVRTRGAHLAIKVLPIYRIYRHFSLKFFNKIQRRKFLLGCINEILHTILEIFLLLHIFRTNFLDEFQQYRCVTEKTHYILKSMEIGN